MNIKQFKEVIIWFENGDSLHLKQNEIKKIIINNIKTNIILDKENIIDFKECEDFIIMIYANGYNKTYIDLDNSISKDLVKDRILNKDIISIEIIYNDESNISINVPWNEKSEYINEYQTSTFIFDTNKNIKTNNIDPTLYIRCHKTKTINEYIKNIY